MPASKDQLIYQANSIVDANADGDPDDPITDFAAARCNELRGLAVESLPILDRMLEPAITSPAGVTYRMLRERCEAVANLVARDAPPAHQRWGRASR